MWLGHEDPGDTRGSNSKIVDLETGFSNCALGPLRGWWVGKGGDGAGVGLWWGWWARGPAPRGYLELSQSSKDL